MRDFPRARAMADQKKLPLIDIDDYRRDTRVQLLAHAGYAVDVRRNYIEAERLDHEGNYDLVIVASHRDAERTIQRQPEPRQANLARPFAERFRGFRSSRYTW